MLPSDPYNENLLITIRTINYKKLVPKIMAQGRGHSKLNFLQMLLRGPWTLIFQESSFLTSLKMQKLQNKRTWRLLADVRVERNDHDHVRLLIDATLGGGAAAVDLGAAVGRILGRGVVRKRRYRRPAITRDQFMVHSYLHDIDFKSWHLPTRSTQSRHEEPIS